jgi:hypothetical protein
MSPIQRTTEALLLLLVGGGWAAAQSSTAFTYQGHLTDNGSPANGLVDLRFTLYTTRTGTASVSLPIDRLNEAPTQGVFTVELDFGADPNSVPYAFGGSVRWLQVDARVPAGADPWVALLPRQGLPAFAYAFRSPAPNLIAGFSENSAAAGVIGATIAGGGGVTPPADPNEPVDPNDPPLPPYVAPNRVLTDFCTVGGGLGNTAGAEPAGSLLAAGSGTGSTVGGGSNNTASGSYSTVAGGRSNAASGDYSSIAGGKDNKAQQTGSSVGGGIGNAATKTYAVVAGGNNNTATDEYCTIGGGTENKCRDYAGVVSGGWQNDIYSGQYSAILGGQYQVIGKDGAISDWSAIVGGASNRVYGDYSTVLGGDSNVVEADCSMAFGRQVTTNNGMRICLFKSGYAGRVAINRDSADGNLNHPFYVGKTSSNGNGAYLSAAGAWHDAGTSGTGWLRERAEPADALERVLSLPIDAWTCPDSGERHIGPRGDDFHAQFDVGPLRDSGERDTSGLAPGDVAGVALLAIQELSRQNDELRAQLRALEERIARLEGRR